MNKEQMDGLKDKIKGKIKEEYGDSTNHTSKKSEGKMDQVKGTVKEKFGDVKEAFNKQK
ncbi:CsbD family protein [Cytobacillus sp. FSL K6-0265]|uniref:CsbD family protein n=1 Tax=Cytobacillus sp. FSL K6-0265 TaxID=2921448 RepID=UPI0030FCE04E